jgi:predicted site-specific integrase-resolvase
MSQFGEKLGGKREAAILALLSTRNVEEAARAAGVNARTLYRWMKEREFDTAYRAGKRAAFGQAIARLHHLASAAVSTLGKVMLDAETPSRNQGKSRRQHLESYR